ncbi:NACHT, LRR and PYD domains-containing protein 3 [Holothuria leucospilota]|uniref:NACHT, LRR and PYD domains-containing protein 3 n=1 Tax=Holothuria leucospilota TaxID=206669 RepID=A0A9Q1C2J8_HOLLE|nr:NACHT, LRR and PYD domains-containing protein 3 [Holothuria leucospilota]
MLHIVLVFLVTSAVTEAAKTFKECVSPQYLEIGTEGVIHCRFPLDFRSIYWYDNVTDEDAQPTLTYKDLVKGGPGYESGEFDIFRNGSLIIKRTSLLHEKTFKVIWFGANELYNVLHISAITTVSPAHIYPQISECEDSSRLCFVHRQQAHTLSCRINASKPPSTVEWIFQTEEEKEVLNSSKEITENFHSTFDTIARLSLSLFGDSVVTMLFCGSRQKHVNDWKYTPIVIDFSQDTSLAIESFDPVYFSINGLIKLQCSSSSANRTNNVIVWKRLSFDKFENIALWTKAYPDNMQIFDNEYSVGTEGSLFITSVQIHHEGKYTCIASNTVEDAVTSFQLFVLVPPSPPYLTVSGCPTLERCIVVSTGTGKVTCSVSGVRPIVSLEWSTEDKRKIHFQREETSMQENSDLFSVYTTLYYNLSLDTECGKVSFVRCSAYGVSTSTFLSVRKVELINAECSRRAEETTDVQIKSVLISIVVFMFVGMCFIGGLLFILLRRKFSDTSKEEGNDDTQIPLVDITDKLKFIEELKITYDELLSNPTTSHEILTSLYIPNRLCMKVEQKLSSQDTSSKHLLSHKDLFHREDIKSRHILIEGEPGHGKTSLINHFLKIWLKPDESPIISFDILIMLSLKDFLQGENSFDVTVRKLLATDSDLTSGKIKAILRQETRYLVLLDDFEQYCEAKDKQSIIHEIMRRNIMRNAKVILMTRPTYLTKTLGKAVTFVRMEGFTESQVDQYVRLTFKEHEEMGNNLKEKLKEDKNVASMCQTPFLLSLCSYIFMKSHYEEKTFESITTFFEKLLTSLQYQFYKSTNKNCDFESALKQKTAKGIAKIAIDGIQGSQPARSKEDLSAKTDVSHFEAITEVGIILETNEISNPFQNNSNESASFKFIHDSFQYFFGAMYLAFHASSEEFDDYLKSIDVYSCQQLLVFTCGLSQKEAVVNKIVRHLLKKQDHYPFPIRDCIVRCLMEVTCDDWKERKEVLTDLCTKEYALSIREFDSTTMKNAKAYLINICSELAVPFNVMSLSLVVQRTEESYVFLDSGVSFKLPPSIRSFSVRDFHGIYNDEDVMFLIEHTENLEEIIIYSNLIPSVCTKQALDIIKNRGIQVIWVTLQDGFVVTISFPSTFRGVWLTYAEMGVLMYLRFRGPLKSLPKEEAYSKEETIVAQLKKKGFKKFLKKSRNFNIIERKTLIKYVKEDMKTIEGLINEWLWLYEANNEESEKEHHEKFEKHIAKLRNRLELVQNRGERKKDHPTVRQQVQANNTTQCQPENRMRSLSATLQLKDLFQEIQL